MMNRLRVFLAFFILALGGFATAQIVPSLPYNLTNGTIADANQVMANFNQIVSSTNTNAAGAGANTNITALLGLTTPLGPSSGGSSVYTGGASAGTLNAQTLLTPSPIGYVLASGRRVTFIAGFTNSGPTTLNVNSTGAINVLKQSTAGLVALAGGEIVVGQAVDVWYDGTQYELLNASPQALVSAGTILDWGGMTIPSGYLRADGAPVSRTIYATLFAFYSFSTAASTTNGSKIVTGLSSTTTLKAGMPVGGNNVTCGDTIATVDSATQITLTTNNASATGATTLIFAPWGVGDCSTTFNLPSLAGRALADADGATNLTSTTCTRAGTIGTTCGTQTKTLVTANLPPYTPAGTNASSASTVSDIIRNAAGVQSSGAGGGANGQLSGTSGTAGAISVAGQTFTGTAQGGVSTPLSSIAPIAIVYKIVKY